MERLYSRFKDWIEFFVVYVQEAHPTDGWQVESNIKDDVFYRQHQSLDEREEAAQSCTYLFLFLFWLKRWTMPSTKPTVRPRNDCT